MSETAAAAAGSARPQADLWSERAQDWAEVMEGWNGWGIPLYRYVLDHVTVSTGTAVLDVGCGAGRFSRIAADRGATVAGLDATEPLIEIARTRVLDGDFRVGEMEALPWADDSFDVVTGFNSFFIAADMTNALREARRVARPGGTVALTVFGRPERCQSTEVFSALKRFAPPGTGQASSAPSAPGLHEEGVLEARATEAGLTPRHATYLPFAEEYPDLATMLRGYLAAPPFVRAARAAGEDAVREALSEALRPLETPSGRYRLRDEVRVLIASA
ncbi:class I SAM-dependent methyltransferase [Paraconexibacter sp.]|uniref:class I SAM-dependent methyltransferase n=1 Tax=Paraconexibacter sp. TaxID=2949640 RepID=UPI003569FDCF